MNVQFPDYIPLSKKQKLIAEAIEVSKTLDHPRTNHLESLLWEIFNYYSTSTVYET